MVSLTGFRVWGLGFRADLRRNKEALSSLGILPVAWKPFRYRNVSLDFGLFGLRV